MAYKSGHIYLIDHEPTGEELNSFAKPVQFDICSNGQFYSILYDKAGNKFIQNQSKIVTGFIKIGEIVQNENHITIGVHPSGFTHWRINGVDVTTAQAAVLEVDPVADGEFRIDWIVGNSAGGLFILPGEAGKIPLKPNPLDYPSFAFFTEVLVTPDGLGGGIVTLNLADVFTGDGNAVALDIKEASTDHRGTMSSAHWSKLELINPSLYATLAGLDAEIVNRAAADVVNHNAILAEANSRIVADTNLQNQVNTINSRTSSVVDKAIHFWDSNAGKWLNSGVQWLADAMLKLKLIYFQGYTVDQRNAISSPQDGMLVYVNETGSKGFWKYENGAWFSMDGKSKLLMRYIRNENTEYYFSSFNYATGIGTTTVPHGIGATPVQVGIFPNNAKTLSDSSTYDLFPAQIKAIPFEYLKANLYVKAVDGTNLQVCDSVGTAITVNTTSTENNNNLDFSKWHIEQFQKLQMPNLPTGYKNIRLVITGYSSSSKLSVMGWGFHTKNSPVTILSPFGAATSLGGSGLVNWGGSTVNANNTVFFQKMIDFITEGGFGIGKCYAFNSYGRRAGQNLVYYDLVFGGASDFYHSLTNVNDYNGIAKFEFFSQTSFTTHLNLSNGTIIEVYQL